MLLSRMRVIKVVISWSSFVYSSEDSLRGAPLHTDRQRAPVLLRASGVKGRNDFTA